MFKTLKKKIKEETGNDVTVTPLYTQNHRYSMQRSSSLSLSNNGNGSATTSLNTTNNSQMYASVTDEMEQNKQEIAALNTQLREFSGKYDTLLTEYEEMMADKDRIEKSNEILEEALKVAQVQKELIYNEQDKIQNIQLEEISKLKSLLHFREQEAVDRVSTIKQKENRLEQIQGENTRLRELEANFEEIQDELEKLRHSSQLEKNNLTSTLAAVEEQNRHLTCKLQIYEEARMNFTLNQSKDEKVQSLLRERRMLEQRLEEAHLHLSDIKGTWSAQNMALETQVDRLSRQVAAETTEKRKALKTQDELAEKLKQITFQLEKAYSEIEQRDQKITLLSEEIDDLSSTLREFKDENEEEVKFLRNKLEKTQIEMDDFKKRLEISVDRLNGQTDESDKLIKTLNARIDALQQELNDVRNLLENEQQEKNAALLKNAEMSQSEERLKQELRSESNEMSELYETIQSLQVSLQMKTNEVEQLIGRLNVLEEKNLQQRAHMDSVDELKKEIHDKNKTIKVLNQRLNDMKKTLQHELKVNNGNSSSTGNGSGLTIALLAENDKLISDMNAPSTVVMDDVNFKYLKHVILKFLTSREVEARHLIRAIGTLLHLSNDEEQLLHETLNFKVSWFGSRPTDVTTKNRQQKLFSISSQSTS